MSELTTSENGEYQRLCGVVQRGMATFVEVGMALVALNEKRLYRAEFPTFEAFVSSRFQLSRRRAYQMMEEAKVASVTPGIQNGAQARALATVNPEDRAAVLAEANENGKLTAASIISAVKKMKGDAAPMEGWRLTSIAERIEKAVLELQEFDGKPVGHWLPMERIATMAERLCKTISDAVPDAECADCEARGCANCAGNGFIPSRLNT